ncbi:GNAT family N-acetyltransferase [Pseudofrankia inefficax]|uniref:Phosphinothricin acetyltransferase n=1 Tax=Pseudofrankia inefficax (strain DSM 45817 / CECT 9037 / DDB 130130 / EuI1c) TaxID=298654 RepID=E3J1E4_PSEI1|nr:GNAT family N-acetyltransferase [Pseudofrankia inefficax]ADP80465.1 Phosphinothricin acetyltransferase [Pseudofrankia inefficax]
MPSEPWQIRPATAADAPACAAIYADYVTDTAITFETEVPSIEEMAGRIQRSNERHAWLVLEVDGTVVGYAYGREYHARAAYGWSCEASVYLRMGRRRTGAGRALYQALLPRLAERGYRRVIAGITQPNDASNGLHYAFGFTDVGVMYKIGWKHGVWHDVAWLQLDLTPDEDPVKPPDPVA